MKKNLTELVFILDRSGSMQGLKGDTIGGFNAMIEKQKKEPGEAFVSTVLFDDQSEVLHDRVKVSDVQPITGKEYYVRGCTALLDAVGGAIHHIGNIHKYARPEECRNTLFSLHYRRHGECQPPLFGPAGERNDPAAKGKVQLAICQAGCIGCRICEKNCEAGAITVTNFLAHIDADKCTECGVCVEKCPRKIITLR